MKEHISYSRRIVFYLMGAVSILALLLGVKELDAVNNTWWISLITKVLIALTFLRVIFIVDREHEIHFSFKMRVKYIWGFLGLTLLVGVAYFAEFNVAINGWQIVLLFVNALLTAIWEEFFYRGFGLALFEKGDLNLGIKAIIVMILPFVLVSLLNGICNSSSVGEITLIMLETTANGYFLIMYMLYSKNAIYPLLAHIFATFIMNLMPMVSTSLPMVGTMAHYIIFILIIVYDLAVGTIMYRKHIKELNLRQC